MASRADTKNSISNDFFEDEIRCGFFVPAIIKQEWAVGLAILNEIDRICEKHHIQFFADWGTLLGAVRHGGYIPWDDDLDIVMKRADYIRFCEIAEKELPEGYELHNFKSRDDYWQFTSKVLNKGRICFEQEHLEKFHQFPYMVGVDIFVLDYISTDPEANRKRNEEALFAIALGDGIGTEKTNRGAIENALRRVEEFSGEKVQRDLSPTQMRRRLYEIAEHLFAKFLEKDSQELSQLFPFALRGGGFSSPKAYYAESVRLPFESTTIPVPLYYDAMLRKRYTNYMRLVKDGGAHDYPYFEEQIRSLKSVLDFEMPHYQYSKDDVRKEQTKKDVEADENSFKSLALACLSGLKQLQIEFEGFCNSGDQNAALARLQESQQLAIDLGTLIDNVKGDGSPAVESLERYCEIVFRIAEDITNNKADVHKETDLCEALGVISERVKKYVINRKEIVFLPCKATWWRHMEFFWKAALQEENCDVYVVPLPIFYKRYDGSVTGERFDIDDYPAEVEVVDYKTFDLNLHHPDQVFIQNPYDEWHATTTIPPQYYSEKLQWMTDELVYVEPYVTEEFNKSDYREYHNTQYYIPMPGVVLADKIYVQSENMKQVYTERLCEFAGDESASVWEKKIHIAESLTCRNNVNNIKAENKKRQILFYINAGYLAEYHEKGIEKLRYAFEELKKRKDQLQVLFLPDFGLEEVTNRVDSSLYMNYIEFLREMKFEQWNAKIVSEQDLPGYIENATEIDFYYGDGGRFALDFIKKHKPVMILEVNA